MSFLSSPFGSFVTRSLCALAEPDQSFKAFKVHSSAQDLGIENPWGSVAMQDGRPVDQSASYYPQPFCVAHAPAYKRVPVTTLCGTTTFSPPIPFIPFPRHHASFVMQKTAMSTLTSTTVGAREVLGYPEHAGGGGGTDATLHDTTSPRVFDVSCNSPFMILAM